MMLEVLQSHGDGLLRGRGGDRGFRAELLERDGDGGLPVHDGVLAQ